MGQAESGENDDENCFRGCMKQNKTKTKKIQAVPHYGQKKASDVYKETPQPFCSPPKHNKPEKSPIKRSQNPDELETSLEQRLYTEQVTIKKKISVQHSTNIVTTDPREPPLVQGAADISTDIVLGLQSKFSSTKNTCYVSTSKMALIKTNAFCEATSPGTQYNSNEKESGSQTRITNKTNRTTTSTKSRNILMNKIQEIKQKYYERELEIEICHDEREYQAQIDQLEQIEKTFTENSYLPEQSIGQIKAIRNKILAKLRQKREKNQEKQHVQVNNCTDQASLTLNIDKSLAVHDQLELYSREGKVAFDDTLLESQTAKKQKKKNHLSFSGRNLNKSLNNSATQGSVDEKMEFSDYSEESLHEIRELDEQYEDYRSKMTGPSGFHKNNLRSIKPSQYNTPSNMPRSPTMSRCTKLNSAYVGQQYVQPQLPIPFNTNQISPSQVQNEEKLPCQNSEVKSYRVKQIDKGPSTSKSNKILLF